MTVEENLLMGGYIKDKAEESYQEAEKILEKYERLRNRRNQPAKVFIRRRAKIARNFKSISDETFCIISRRTINWFRTKIY